MTVKTAAALKANFMSADPAAPMSLFGQCMDGAIPFEPPSASLLSGSPGWKFIRGISSYAGSPLAGVVVKTFRTTDDLLVGTTISAADGTYRAPTPYPSPTQHYLVEYKSPENYTGASINTLTATNIDGT